MRKSVMLDSIIKKKEFVSSLLLERQLHTILIDKEKLKFTYPSGFLIDLE